MIKVALGWSNVAGLASVSPQPFCEEWQYGAFEHAASGIASIEGRPHTYLVYTLAPHDNLPAILDTYGVTEDVPYKQITILLPNNRNEHVVRNAYALYPEPGKEFKKDMAFYKPIKVPIIGLRVPA